MFCCWCILSITPCLKLSSSFLCGTHGTASVAHQALPFVTATDSANFVSFGVYTMFPVHLGKRNEGTISGGAIDWTLRTQVAGRHKPTLASGFKTAKVPTATTAQPYSSSTAAPALRTLAFVTAKAVLSCSYVCAVFGRRYMQS